jgi:glycosyltransferase involved in cell wall biosynthesis
MNVLLISTFDKKYGGAARSAYRLHRGLINIGINSEMLVQAKDSDDDTVIGPPNSISKTINRFRHSSDGLPLKFYSCKDPSPFSLQWLPDRLPARISSINPDVINLHWINSGYLQIETLAQFKKPIVWTLHDMWAFTGGCHYTGGCDRYTKSCGVCPQLKSKREKDLSRWVWNRKAEAWKNINLTVVTPSRWLADCVQKSSLFQDLKVEVIPYGLDIQVFKPIDKKLARYILNLPLDKKLILFGSVTGTSDPRKGFHLLLEAIQKLSQYVNNQDVELVIFGASQPSHPPNFGVKTYYLGSLSDEVALSLVYSAVDVFVAPSIEDNLPNTIIESLACGTPCVGFKIGGIPELIDHQENGYLAERLDPEDLLTGITQILENDDYYLKLSANARSKAIFQYNLDLQSSRYLKIFESLTQK